MDTSQQILQAVELTSKGQHDKADRIITRVLNRDPGNFDALHASALVDIGRSRGGRALKKLQTLKDSASPEQASKLWNSLGLAHELNADLDLAAAAYKQAYDANPHAYEAGMNLARCLEARENYPEAIKICRFLLGTFEGDLAARFLSITCSYKLGDTDGALQEFIALGSEAALSLKQYEQICNLLEKHYRYQDLRALASGARGHYPESSSLAIFIARCDIENKDYGHAIEVLEAVPTKNLPDSLRAHLHNELALAKDRVADYAGAFQEFERSNMLQRQQYKLARIRKSNATAPFRKLFDQEGFAAYWQNSSRPDAGSDLCFLVGFPRSGTTLLERLLDAHSAVLTLPELDFLQQLIDSLGGLEKYQYKLQDLEEPELEKLEAMYREALETELPAGRPPRLIVDKMPLNLIHVPLIKKVFPAASFILAVRHPADCTLSCIMQNFRMNGEMAHFLSLQEATSRYADVFSLWNTYQSQLPMDVHTIRYEDLVVGFDNEVSALMGFLDLEFEPAQRLFHEQTVEQGGIRTPSYRQVSKPVYQSSSYRWKNYAFAMTPHLPTLMPFIEQFGYAED